MGKYLKQIEIAVILPRLKRGFAIILTLSLLLLVLSIVLMSIFNIIELGLFVLCASLIGIYASNVVDWSKKDGSLILTDKLIKRIKKGEGSETMQISDISKISFIYNQNAESITYSLSTGGIHNYLTFIDIEERIKKYHVFIKSDKQAKYILKMLEIYKSQGVNVNLRKKG